MAADVLPRYQISSDQYNISRALATESDPTLHITYPNRKNSMFFGGQAKLRGMEPGTKRFENAGFKVLFKTNAAHNGVAGGPFGQSTVFAKPSSQRSYDNWIYRQLQLGSIQWPNIFDWVSDQLITSPTELNDMAAAIQLEANEGALEVEDLLFMSDRRGILGNVIAISAPVADTGPAESISLGLLAGKTAFTGCYRATMLLGASTQLPVFQPGRLLHICAGLDGAGAPVLAQNNGNPLQSVRNYGVPCVVTSIAPRSSYNQTFDGVTTAGAFHQVEVAFPYTGAADATLQATVLTQIQSIVAGDVITLWGGATAGTSLTTYPTTYGPNHGFQGIRHWLSKRNFETVCSLNGDPNYGIQSELPITSTFTTVDRTLARWNFSVPVVLSAGGTKATLDYVKDITKNLYNVLGEKLTDKYAIMTGDLVLQGIINQVGLSGYRQNDVATEAKSKRWAKFGFSGAAYNGIHVAGPMMVGTHPAIPNDMLMVCDPDCLTRIGPFAPQFYPNANGGVLHDIQSSAGVGDTQLTPRKMVTRLLSSQLHMDDAFEQGGLTETQPGE